jgi:RNA polymerase sigma-70 factor, ECF subfamily
MRDDPDVELMLRLKNGEDWILNELMTRWQQPLVAFIYRYIGRETEALDLAQETFACVYKARHRYTSRAKFSTWLFTIAGNLCRNYLRWRDRCAESIPDSWDADDAGLAEALQSPDAPPDQAIITAESIATVKKAISMLPHDLKVVILLHEYEGLSYKEIASVIPCSVKAVEMKLYRARKLLREKLVRSDFR